MNIFSWLSRKNQPAKENLNTQSRAPQPQLPPKQSAPELTPSRENIQKLERYIAEFSSEETSLWWDSHRQLAQIPDSIGDLEQLEKVTITRGEMTSVPRSLCRLVKLKELDLSSNGINVLPNMFGELTQLRRLDLSDNELSALPDCIGRLPQLEELDLSRNPLGSVPTWITQLKSLKILRLQKTGVSRLPDGMEQLTSLRTLSVQENKLTTFPNGLGDLPNLEELIIHEGLGGNPMQTLPECIRRMRHLKELHACEYQMEELPEWIGELTELRYLRLSYGKLRDLPVSLLKLKKLEVLNLNENPLNDELAAADEEGLESVRQYLQNKASPSQHRAPAVRQKVANAPGCGHRGAKHKCTLCGSIWCNDCLNALLQHAMIEIGFAAVVGPIFDKNGRAFCPDCGKTQLQRSRVNTTVVRG